MALIGNYTPNQLSLIKAVTEAFDYHFPEEAVIIIIASHKHLDVLSVVSEVDRDKLLNLALSTSSQPQQ